MMMELVITDPVGIKQKRIMVNALKILEKNTTQCIIMEYHMHFEDTPKVKIRLIILVYLF